MRWMRTSRLKGADAFYFRFQGLPAALAAFATPFVLELLERNPVPSLFPSGNYPEADFTGIQYRVSELESDDFARQGAFAGASCHSAAEVEKAISAGIDFCFLSPVFSTKTHPEASPLGLEAFGKICHYYPKMPIFALGGITPQNESACLRGGGHGIAAIRYFL